MSEAKVRHDNNKHQEAESCILPTKSGVIFLFKVCDRLFESDKSKLTVAEALSLAGIDQTIHALTRIKEGCKEILYPDQHIDLSSYGIEEFFIEKVFVEVFFKEQKFLIRAGDILVTELKKFLGIPQANHISVLVNGEIKPLKDNEKICIHGGEHFVSYPCDGKAS